MSNTYQNKQSYNCITLIVFLIFLVNYSLSCHPSCVCQEGQNKCLSCVDVHSTVDARGLSCPCIDGWFTGSLIPFRCEEYFRGGCNSDTFLVLDSCNVEIGRKVRDVNVGIQNKYVTLQQGKVIVISIFLDFSNISMSDTCLDKFFTNLQYIQTKIDNIFQEFPSSLATSGPRGSWTLTLSIDNLNNFSDSSVIRNGQIITQLSLQLLIGTQNSFSRIHQWNLVVSTQTNQVLLFNIRQSTIVGRAINNCMDCIVIADVQTQSRLCSDQSCQTSRLNAPYIVGDQFMVQISFTDPSYTSKLSFVSLIMKTDNNSIYDLSQNTTAVWSPNYLFVSVKLPYASLQAVLQITMVIEPVDGKGATRMLELISDNSTFTDKTKAAQQVFNAVILSNNTAFTFSTIIQANVMLFAVIFIMLIVM